MEEWKECNIGDITTYKKGFAFKLDDYKSSGRRIVKVSNLNQDIYDESKYVYLDLSEIEKHKDVILKKSDIVISTVGSWPNNPNSVVGKVTRIPQYLEGSLLNQNAVIFRGNNEVSQDFLYYLLKDDLFTNYIIGTAQGSASQASIKLTDIMNYPVHLPPLPTQQKIAAILSSLDDKIELNNKINENLEQQAQALFKSWFVDFEPFGGKRPENWKEDSLGNICECVLGGTPSRVKKDYWNGNIPWINSGEVNLFRIIEPSEYITNEGLIHSATKLLPKKTTVIAITGATLGQVSLLEIDSCANQSVVGIIPNECLPYVYIYPMINERIKELILNQTGGAQQHINKQNVQSLLINLPTKEILDNFEKKVLPIYETIANNCFENKNLALLRDFLLPKLMNGEIEV